MAYHSVIIVSSSCIRCSTNKNICEHSHWYEPPSLLVYICLHFDEPPPPENAGVIIECPLKVIFASNYWFFLQKSVFGVPFEKNIKESGFETFKNISAEGVHCWYIRDAFTEFSQQLFEEKN